MKKKVEHCHSPVFCNNNLPEILRFTNTFTKSPVFRTTGSKSISGTGTHSKKSSHRDFVLPPFLEKSETRLSLDVNAFSNYMTESSVKQSLIGEPSVEFLNMGSPAGRKEIQKLIEWLDAMLQSVVDTKKNPEELFELTNEIYSCCLKEVIRQVSVHCKERGYLISRVWVAYKNLFEKALMIAKSNEVMLKEKLIRDLQMKTSVYTEHIESLQEKISSLTETNQKLEAEQLRTGSGFDSLHSENSKNLEMIGYIQGRYKILRKELLVSREENRILNGKLLNYSDSAQKPKNEQKKIKMKSVKFLSAMLARDPVLSILKYKDQQITPLSIKYGKA